MPLSVNRSRAQTMLTEEVGGIPMSVSMRQRSDELITYQIDYSRWLPIGETISSVTFAVSPTTAPALVIGPPEYLSGSKVLFLVSAGKDASRYKITSTAVTSGGQTKVDTFYLNIGQVGISASYGGTLIISLEQSALEAAMSAAAALVSKNAAAASAAAALASENGAATSEANALASQDAAAASAAAALISQNSALASQNSATASQNAAAASAAAALASENSAAASYVGFHNAYYGPLAANPTLRPDGSAMQIGDLYYNSVALELRVREAASWVAAALSPAGFLSSTNNLSDVANASAARANLGANDAGNLTTGTLPAARLPNPSAVALGGVKSLAAAVSKWINSIGTDGLPTASQPATADLSDAGLANGCATLDSGGKVPTSQLPSSVLGNVAYQGTWDANTNTPAIPAASAANKGYYYKVSVNGATLIDGTSDWKVGDWIISNGTTWDKIDNTDQVTSVAGKTGAVALDAADLASGTLPDARMPAFTGDITTVAGSVATTIANLVVTAAKIADTTITYAKMASAAIASSANYLANAASVLLTPNAVWSAAAPVTLTDAATIAVDFSTFINANVTIAGNRTLGNPTNVKTGQSGIIVIQQDATGSRTLSFASNWKFIGGQASTLSTPAYSVDILSYYAHSPTFIVVSLMRAVA